MGNTYTRQSSFTDGDVITADLFNNEYDQLLAAFAASTGHTHDGTAAEGGPITKLLGTSITIGDATSGTDITVTFDGESNDGVFKWMEDEDYFEYSDDILIASTEKLQFRDTAIYINSSADGQLDLVADTEIQIAATTIDINGAADISGNLAVGGNLTVTGTTTFNGGTLTLGDSSADNVVFGADVDSSIIPDDDDTYDLGSASQQWRNIFIDGTAEIDTLAINGTTVTSTAAELNILDGVTSTAAEINIVDGDTSATATTVADADRVVLNDNGTMVQVAVTDLAAYFDDEITAMPNLVTTAATTVGALNSGSITSGFGTIDTGSSTITTTGLISGGSLDIDDVVINGSTIGHTDDTDLITVASGIATVAGELSVTTLDIGGTNVTSTATELNLLDGVSGLVQADFTKLAAVDSTAAELNIVDGGTSATSTTVVDADRVVMNDNGTMVQVAVTDLAAYFDDEITAMPNLVTTAATTVGALNSGSITSGFGTIDTGSSNITTTGVGAFGSLDISGDIDVDGTTNLDVVDIDGAVDMASTLGVTGVLTANAGVVVDNITIDGTEIDLSSGDLTIDVAGDIILDADDGIVNFKDGGTAYGLVAKSGNNLIIKSEISDGDLVIRGNDGGSEVDALTLDMSAAGAATFNSTVTSTGLASTTSGTSNFIAGVNAGNSIASGGNQNTLIGDEAGTAITTGDENVFVGFQSGDALVDGTFNVAVGVNSLTTDTKGKKSVAIGTNALATQNFTTLTDTFNTAVGHSAGTAVTTGIKNTLIGGEAGDALTDADENVVVGYGALTSDTLGSKSTAIGRAALATQNFTTATNSNNTAVGYHAGLLVTTGVNNTLLGDRTGDALTDADNNIAIGQGALTSDTLGSKSVAIGVQALSAQNFTTATDSHNTAVGYEAGTAVSTGIRNTLIGSGSGAALTTGEKNTAVGRNAMTSIIDADENTAIGDGSLAADTKGTKSTAIGRDALGTQNFTTATDSFNTAVGHAAGVSVTTGTYNTLIGAQSGDALTTGQENVAVGTATLTADTQGRNSVAIGHSALEAQNFTTATESHNVAIGHNTAKAITTGLENTLIGSQAGDALTDADYNVVVGTSALSADTLGSRSIAIGYKALEAQNFTTATDTYNVAMGHFAGGSITTGTSSTLIGGLAGDALTTAGRNVAVGRSALSTETSGANCVAIGTFALTTQNVGNGANVANTAIGYDSGQAVTTGIQNTLVGAYVGDALTDGADNVAVGYNSLGADTRGTKSVAIGKEALKVQNQTTSVSTYNVAVGFKAGVAVTTGIKNTFVGAEAGDSATDSEFCVAVGYGAMGGADPANANVGIGVSSLQVVTGALNTGLGHASGLTVTSGENNLFLGADSGRVGSPGGNITTADNTVVVGDENISACHIQTDWTVASDQRDKTDFTALDLGLDFVKALAPVTYKWDKRSKYGDKYADDYDLLDQTPDGTHKEDWLDIGFKAQEVQALEEAAGYTTAAKKNLTVSTSGDGKQMGLQYSKFVPILVKAIQELEARVKELEG